MPGELGLLALHINDEGKGRAQSEARVLTHRPLAIGRGGNIDVGLLDEHCANLCR